MDRIGEVGEEQAAGIYGTDYTAGSLARKEASGGTGNKVSSDKELTEVGSPQSDVMARTLLTKGSRATDTIAKH